LQFDSFLNRDIWAKFFIGSMFHPSISVNNRTFRGDLHDSNNLFKAVCSMMLDRPEECKKLSIYSAHKTKVAAPVSMTKEQKEEEMKKAFTEHENTKADMDKRAGTVEVVLVFVVLLVNSCGVAILCNWYYRQKSNERMKNQVHEQVAQYFQIPQDDKSGPAPDPSK